jgi:hypothetical protein
MVAAGGLGAGTAGSFSNNMPLSHQVVMLFWRALLVGMLVLDCLMCVVSGASLENNSAYQACLASPYTCTNLCVPPPCPPVSLERSWLLGSPVWLRGGPTYPRPDVCAVTGL